MHRSFLVKAFIVVVGLAFLCFKPKNKRITIFSIGDSTMAWYNIGELSKKYGGENYPLRGQMMMPQFFKKSVTIKDEAISGISSKSFRDEGAWKKVINEVQSGDHVFVHFGHNDEKPESANHTDPHSTFRQNLINYITETQAKGAHPILFTSIVRRNFDANGHLVDTHGDYITVVRELAKEEHIPLVDLNKKT